MAWTTEQYLEAIRSAEEAGNQELADQITGMMAESMTQTRGPMETVAHGATLGLSSLISESAREAVKEYREREPGAAMGLSMLGGLGAGTVIGAGVGAGARLPGMAGRAAQWLSRPRMAPQATLGAAEGAVLGVSEAEPGERLTGAGTGALFGGGVGGLSAPVSGAIGRRLAPGREAEDLLERSIAQDLGRRPTAADYVGFEQRAAAQPELTFAEMPGMQTQALARTMTAMGEGAGLQQATNVLRERARGTSGRLVGRLRELTGAEGDYYQNLEALGRQRAEDAAPLYQQAYEAPFEVTEEVVDTLGALSDAGWLRAAYNKARSLAAASREQAKLPPWSEFSKQVDEAGAYDLEVFDWLKQGLDAQYDALVRKSPREARALWGLRQELVSELDEAVPQYAAARRAYAGPSAQMDAQEAGRNILKEDAGLTESTLRDLSDAEREAYVLGATEAISQRLRSRPRRTGGVTPIPEYVEDRLRFAFPDEDSFQAFLTAVDAEQDMQGFKNMLLTRSPTADILTAQESMQRAGGLGRALGSVLTGNVREGIEQAAGVLRPPRQDVLSGRIADPLTGMLFSQGPAVPGVLQRLQRPGVMPSALAPMTTTQATIVADEARRRLRLR